jgi:1-acyl-sn-glycerol-3-phosphate acyltransferase
MESARPKTPASAPQRWHGPASWLGRLVLRMMGFRIEGALPRVPRVVIVGAPHTSNWDFVVGAATMMALELDITWLGKHTLFHWPFGGLMRFLGGVPVDRNRVHGVVEGAVAAFRAAERRFVAIAPEGTRGRVAEWKSGFHRIAVAAGVPIFPVAFDYARRVVLLMPVYEPKGDFAADVAALKALYRPEMARYPENFWD